MKLTIFKRLTIGYFLIMGLLVYLGAYAILKLNQINLIIKEIDSIEAAAIRLTEHLSDSLFSQINFEKKYLVSKDPDFYQQFIQIEDYIKKDMAKLAYLMNTDEKKELFLEIKALYGSYLNILEKEYAYIKKAKSYQENEYQTQKNNLIDIISRKLMQIIKTANLDRDNKISASRQLSVQVLRTTTITASLVIFIGIIISMLNTRSINRSVVLLQKKTKEIAEGRFEKIHNIKSPPEIRDLADDFNIMCERLRELDDMKIDFISHISHELHTPLTAIKEASSMLIEGIYASCYEKQYELLMIIHEDCLKMIESVNRILDLSRMEAKMMDYHFHECCLVSLIKKSVHTVAPIIESKNINLEIGITQNLPMLRIDERRIEQVLDNILGNALKFTSDEGLVKINVNEKNGRKKYIEVSIADTGFGIPQQDLYKIFDKFQRIEDNRGTVRGTGLGLSIAKHIITAHGGEIWAKSESKKGSTFYFTLPVS